MWERERSRSPFNLSRRLLSPPPSSLASYIHGPPPSIPIWKMDAVDFLRIRRIVLLVDLHPLLSLENPSPYLSNVLAVARRILSFSALSSSLAAFKLFFSSLSPILSTSVLRSLLGKSPTLLSFDCPLQTLDCLSRTLDFFSSTNDPIKSDRSASSRATLMAWSLLQLEYDYAWELQGCFNGSGGMLDTPRTSSNLVLLFSPFPHTFSCLSDYFDESSLSSFDMFSKKFLQTFGTVKARLCPMDFHVSWIDVSFESLCEVKRPTLGFFERGVQELGWGCYRAESIVVGSAIIPFGLIFPFIGCSLGCQTFGSARKERAELVLGIKDSSGVRLECKSCDVEVLLLRLAEERPDISLHFSTNRGKSNTKIRIKEVRNIEIGPKVIKNVCTLFLLQGMPGKTKKNSPENSSGQVILDRVLELICAYPGKLDSGKPTWQLILTYLYSRKYSSLVSVSDNEGNSVDGILQPFTINHALLSIFPKSFDSSVFDKHIAADNRRRISKTQTNLLHDVTWNTFCNTVFGKSDNFSPEIGLEDLYFNFQSTTSKKLKFLKCWMKQNKRPNSSFEFEKNEESISSSVKEVEEENSSSQQGSERQNCSSSADNCQSQSAIQSASSFVCLEDSEAFLGSILQKIEHALCSKEVDLWILAQRLVVLTIDALYAKYNTIMVKKLDILKDADSLDVKIAIELFQLLLKKPEDLELKCKIFTSASSSSELGSITCTIERKLRLHEIQILFRMEILQSKVSSSFDDCMKRKMIKDICTLLQNVEFYLQADFFGGQCLLEFATKIIKSRYEQSLEDVVHQIYDHMEFSSFAEDEMEALDSVPARKGDEPQNYENVTMDSIQNALRPKECYEKNQEGMENVIDHQLMEAQERRNRARRLASFTTWVPDLQRVWALRQPFLVRKLRENFVKTKPRKKRRHSSTNDRVLETPETWKNKLSR
ncbi:hypothetical protein AXF42_Ash011995 [Apostasia shenzhenica]|uniref:Treslin N-terminal domain-containing protein n=1 Tax=Apostasia shenzhenica TaxID=1088818 RepID=A0A2I0AJG2_9ASPA|nr:hypothetical protein AXF42_Ash011995 [Apostasia shenzhenica]